MGWIRRLKIQDWLLTIVAAAAVAFVVEIWIYQTPRADVSVIGSQARELKATQQWLVQFVFHNRGTAPADRVRVRILTSFLRAPDRLQLSDDFILANPLDPQTDVIRSFLGPKPPEADQPAQDAAPAKPAAKQGADKQAAEPAAPAAPVNPPLRNFVIVLQADYGTGGAFGGTGHKRWYYIYSEGDGAAVQAGQALKDRAAESADALLR